MKLPPSVDKLVSAVLAVAPNTIIVNQSGTPVEVSSLSSRIRLVKLEELALTQSDASFSDALDLRSVDRPSLMVRRKRDWTRHRGYHLREGEPQRKARSVVPCSTSGLSRLLGLSFVASSRLNLTFFIEADPPSSTISAGENGKLFYNDNIFVGYRGLLEFE